MRCRYRSAQAGQARGHRRRYHRQHKQIFHLTIARHHKGALIGVTNHRHNGRLSKQGIKTGRFQPIDELAGIGIQLGNSPRLIQDYLKGRLRRRRLGRGQRCREDIRPAGMAHIIDQVFAPGDITAYRGNRLAQRAHLDIDHIGHAKMLFDAAPGLTQHTHRMSFIDHQPGAIFATQLDHLGKIDNIAIHAEHRIGHHQLAGPIWNLLQPVLQCFHIVMPETQELGPRH